MRAFVLLATLLLSLVAPACAADDVATAQGIIRSQVEAFGRDDAATAYSYAAPAIQNMFPQADIFLAHGPAQLCAGLSPQEFRIRRGRAMDGKIAQQVHIVDADGVPWEALYTLELEPDGNVRISGCVLLKTGQGV